MKSLFILLGLVYFCVVDSKYLIKKKPKTIEPNEWNVPQVPEMAFDVYPGVEWHTLEQKYDYKISGEDLAQIETMAARELDMNAALIGKVKSSITSNGNKVKYRFLIE